jgi:ATP-dependent exoDNAse (exonuclease V) alpha subunit
MRRGNDGTVDVRAARPGDRVDQVGNGNRWRVVGIDHNTNRAAAEGLTDQARIVFEGDYLKDHVTLGYAATVHSAQGVIADSSYAIPGEGASRAMLYAAMTRGRRVVEGDTNWSTYWSRRTARCRRVGQTMERCGKTSSALGLVCAQCR